MEREITFLYFSPFFNPFINFLKLTFWKWLLSGRNWHGVTKGHQYSPTGTHFTKSVSERPHPSNLFRKGNELSKRQGTTSLREPSLSVKLFSMGIQGPGSFPQRLRRLRTGGLGRVLRPDSGSEVTLVTPHSTAPSGLEIKIKKTATWGNSANESAT